jgi:hypothetical protein
MIETRIVTSGSQVPTPAPVTSLPFGIWKGTPLPDVPADYLLFTLRKCKLSSGLRSAVTAELTRRGVEVPPAPPLPTIPHCSRCENTLPEFRWQQDSRGQRRIRAECRNCHKFLTFAPLIPPYTTEADHYASRTPVLDALTKLETLGIEVVSDGKRAWVAWPACKRVPNDLLATLRQCSHQLAKMLGDNRPKPPPPQGDRP